MDMNYAVSSLAQGFEDRLPKWIVEDIVHTSNSNEWAVAFRSLCDQIDFWQPKIHPSEWELLDAVGRIYNKTESDQWNIWTLYSLVEDA